MPLDASSITGYTGCIERRRARQEAEQMALKIIRSTDPITVEQLVVLVYGQPGIGKTSAGYTAAAPLLLDFDKGSHRSGFRKDTVRVEDWTEVVRLSPEDLEPYKTIVVDTGGRALDAITSHIGKTNPKSTTGSGALTLQGYGELKAVFTSWVSDLRKLQKDVVILAHDTEDKRGDDLIVRPDFQGGSKHEVIKVADAVGYMAQVGNDKVLNFDPTSSAVCKNCAGLAPMKVPDFSKSPNFLANVIQAMKDKLNEKTEGQRVAAEALSEWKSSIDEAESVDDFSSLIQPVLEADESVRENVKRILWGAAKAKGFRFDKDAGTFANAEAASEPEAQAAG